MSDTPAARSALRALPAFASLSDTLLDHLLPFARQRRVRAGETVFCQGEPSPYYFGILRGEVLISWVAKDGIRPPAEISVLKAGEFFGESSLFSDSPRAAMASAREDGELLLIQGKALRAWIETHPAESMSFLLHVMAAVLERYRLSLPKMFQTH